MEHEYVECDCDCSEHTLRFAWDPDPEYSIIYVSVFLRLFYGFWKRLWLALKYVVGIHTCKFGHFDETSLSHDKVEQLRDLCDRFLSSHIEKPLTKEDEVRIAKVIVEMRKRSLSRAEEQLASVLSGSCKKQEKIE